jgi:surface protein
MTLAEYYGFPEGTKCTRRYYNVVDEHEEGYPLSENMDYFFNNQERSVFPRLLNCTPTSLKNFAYFCDATTLDGLQYMDVSNCTTLEYAFSYMTNLTNIDAIKNWNVSKVTKMNNLFSYCTNLTSIDISNWDTSKVTAMSSLYDNCNKLTTLSAIDCSSISANSYPTCGYSANNTVTTLGGFINMKSNWDNNYGLKLLPNLTYESCINILNGLYDFTGNNQTPTSTQGKLKVHQNFLDLVGDKISIGTNKGWTITA